MYVFPVCIVCFWRGREPAAWFPHRRELGVALSHDLEEHVEANVANAEPIFLLRRVAQDGVVPRDVSRLQGRDGTEHAGNQA